MKKIYSMGLLIAALLFTGCQASVQEEIAVDPWVDFKDHVTVSILCETVLDNWDSLDKALQDGEYIPKDGVMLVQTEVGWEDGDTVFSMLQKLNEAGLITLDHGSDPAMGPYVNGINYLYNGDCGQMSGWLFSINDTFPLTGCDQNPVFPGDNIKWLFSCDMGADVGNEWIPE